MRTGLDVPGDYVKLSEQGCHGLLDVVVAGFVVLEGVLPDVADAKEDGENGPFLLLGAAGDQPTLLLEGDPLVDLSLQFGKEGAVFGQPLGHIGQDVGIQDSIGVLFEAGRARRPGEIVDFVAQELTG